MDITLNGLVGSYGNWECRCFNGNYYVSDAFNNSLHSNLKLSLDLALALTRALDWCEINIHIIPDYTALSAFIKKVRKETNNNTPIDEIFWNFVDFLTIKD